jgi:hypothetical protein
MVAVLKRLKTNKPYLSIEKWGLIFFHWNPLVRGSPKKLRKFILKFIVHFYHKIDKV